MPSAPAVRAPEPAQVHRVASIARRLLRVVVACILVGACWTGPGSAQTTPAQAELGASVGAPFSSTDFGEEATEAADLAWKLELADGAMRSGFHNLAERIYLEILAVAGLGEDVRLRATMGRVNALIGQGRGSDVAQVLEGMVTGRDDAWRLRRAVAHFLVATSSRGDAQRSEFESMRELIRGPRPESLGRDVAWWHFLRSTAANREGDRGQANTQFERALAAASSEAERAMLTLAKMQAGLSEPETTPADLKARVAEHSGKPLGFRFTIQYAVVLDRLGDKAEAITLLKRQREIIPAVMYDERDQTLLALGLVAGAGTEDGRLALRELLERGRDPDHQRIALMRMAHAVRLDSANQAAELKRIITALINRPEPHPLTEDLLVYRAELALRARSFEEAEEDARAVLARFPGSLRFRRNALAILASSSWQRPPRYRTAADYIAQIRALPNLPAVDRARLALLLAECYFRAGRQDRTAEDYRNAAEAYGAVQAAGVPLEGVAPGAVFFQRVLALILSGAPDAAMSLLDDPTARVGVDSESWWQAEWNLTRSLQMAGRGGEALQRIDAMGPSAGVPAELQLRFLWLAAQVSLESARPDETAARIVAVRAFLDSPPGAGIEPALRGEVMSNAGLVEAESYLRANNRDEGRQVIERLRAEFPDSPASDYSFIVQAGFLADENRLVEAMQQLLQLADTRPGSKYAPVALFQAALLNIRRGQDEHLNEANRLLDRMATRYVDYDFPAKLKQAEVKVRLGLFSDAETIYRSLESRYSEHTDRAIVQISLADVLMAQASADPSKFESAVSRLERLMAAENIPVDLRAEAGVKLAAGWQTQGNRARAAEIYWEVNRRFLEDARGATGLGATGPHWISRAVFALGEIEERENRFDNARRLYQSLIDRGLPGDKIARARIDRINAPAGGG